MASRIIPKSRIEEVKSKVSIPDYFDKVILPQMGSYYDLYPVDFDNKPVVCCPLHDEDTPSFRFYPDTGSFYCFGCQKGGNIVNLHRYFTETLTGSMPEYNEAVDFLFNSFIAGRSMETTHIPVGIKQDKKSTEQELLAFNMYRVNTEESLMADKNIAGSVKVEICEAMDKLDTLIDKDIVNATEAKAWLRDFVSNAISTHNS